MHTLNFLHRLFHSIFSMRMVAGFVLVSWNSMKFNEFLWRRDTTNGRCQGPLVWDFVENPIISWDTIKQMRRDTCWELGLLWLLNKDTVMHCFIPFPFKLVKTPDSRLARIEVTELPMPSLACLQPAGSLPALSHSNVTAHKLSTQVQASTPTQEHKYTITSSANKFKQVQPRRYTNTRTKTHNNKLLHTRRPSTNISALDYFPTCSLLDAQLHIAWSTFPLTVDCLMTSSLLSRLTLWISGCCRSPEACSRLEACGRWWLITVDPLAILKP